MARPFGESGNRKRRRPRGNVATGTMSGPVYYRAPSRPAARRSPVDPLVGQLNAIFGPQQNYLASAISRERQQAAQQAAQQQAVMAEFAKWYAAHGPQQIQSIYGTAAQQQTGFAKGFSDGMQIAQRQGAGEANKLIANAGAPAEQQIHVGPEAANVVYGVGGFIPGSTLNQQGAAFASAAALMPGAIAAEGSRSAQKILADSAERVFKLQGELAQLESKRAEIGLKISESRRAERIKLQLEKLKMKIAAQKTEFDQNLATQKFALDKWKAEHPNLQTFGSKEGGYYAIDPSTGQIQQIVAGTGPNPGKFQKTTVGGKAYVFDPNTGTFYDPATGKPAVPRGSGTPVSGKIISAGWQKIKRAKKGWWASQADPDTALSPSELRQTLKDSGYTLGDLNSLSDEELDKIGIAYYKAEPQEVYLDLVRSGIPARRAWQMVRKEFPDWGKGYFKEGKANAPQAGANGVFLPTSTKVTPGSEFGVVDREGAPAANGQKYHAAKDWFAPQGSAVFSPEAGRVIEVKQATTYTGQVYGGVVKVQTADGRVWVFRHVDPRGVRVGQRVTAGRQIATISPWTGRTHVHIELWKTLAGGYRYENMIDPMSFFSAFV